MVRVAAAFLLAAGFATAQDRDLIDGFSYPDDAAARAAWSPMGGTAPVSVVEKEGRRALRMPCNFRGTTIERASWDRRLRLDLSSARGVRFDCLCPDPGPVSHFSFYMQSGGGWYSASFAPAEKGRWCTVLIDKEDTGIEGSPAGWGRIGTVRVSAWRGADRDAELYISNFRAVGRDARVAIVRADSLSKGGEADSARTYAQSVARCLKDLGVSYVVLGDLDVSAETLRGRRLVILPHNPSVPPAAAAAVADFVRGGGKLISFYSIPAPPIAGAAGIEPGPYVREKFQGFFASMRFADPLPAGMPPSVGQRSWNIVDAKPAPGRGRVAAYWHDKEGNLTGHAAVIQTDAAFHVTHVLVPDDLPAKRRMILAMVGHFAPEIWREAADAAAERAGRIGSYAGFEEARKAIAGWARGDREALADLEDAARRRSEAAGLAAQGRFQESIAKAEEAQRSVLLAFCRAQKPERGEHRAFWCHTAHGAGGLDWEAAVRHLAENGFTAVIPNMLWGGSADYESSVLPVSAEARQKGDAVAKCLAACRKYGIQCHVWKVNWNTGGRAPREFIEKMKREGRTQVSFDGSANDHWLCPSHPLNRRLERDAMVEVAAKYPVDGIHFDYIRYPGRNGCFCQGCRERFEAAIGDKVGRWPADLRSDKALEAKWLDFRRDQITALVAEVHQAARKARPGIKISAAVWPNWAVDRDSIGQDWKLWCERGYLDFVCPMDYTPHNSVFESLVSQQVQWAGRVPCYPGIGLSCWTPPDDVVGLVEKILITRRLRTGGFTVFDYSPEATRRVVELCGLGITRR